MSARGERILVGLAVLISLALTVITISAVMRQSDTLSEREHGELRESAARIAQEHLAELRGDLTRLFNQAVGAWNEAGRRGLDRWAARQADWPVLFLEATPNNWTPLPIAPAQDPFVMPAADELAPLEELEFNEQDYMAALERIERLVERSSSPVTRAAALLTGAAIRRKSGAPLAAARAYRDVAPLLEAQPELAHGAFWATLAEIESWLEARQFALARVAIYDLLRTMRNAHPGRYGEVDVALIRSRVRWLRARSPAALLNQEERAQDEAIDALLIEVDRRAQRRDQFAALNSELRRVLVKRPEIGAAAIAFVSLRADPQTPIVAAIRAIAPGRRLVIAAPAQALLDRYWGTPDTARPWHVVLPDQAGLAEPIHALGEPFGGAWVVPTLATVQAFSEGAARRLVLLISVTAGTAGAWAVVLWMLARAVGRQRELVTLQRRFVADVSHELKTPLALIRLLTETLQDQRVRDPQRVQQYLGTIGRESERLTHLLDSILDFSKIESGRKQYQLSECDVGEVARRAWALFEPRFTADGFDAELRIAAGLPLIQGDAEALQQLIVNLLQNAHRYAGEARFVRLEVQGRADGGVNILVEDRGIGMTRAQLKRIGSSFYRADDPRVRQMRGTGLGLAIVRHIVAAHHGELDVQSRPGRGTVFAVRLPPARG